MSSEPGQTSTLNQTLYRPARGTDFRAMQNLIQRFPFRLARNRCWTVVALLVSLTGFAPAATAEPEHPAQEMVVNTVDKLLAVVRNDADRIKNEPGFLDARIEELVVPSLDFEAMTKLSVGKYWRRADDEQKKALVREFSAFLLNTYTSAIDEYKGGVVTFETFKPQSREDRAVVRSRFTQSGSADVPVIYKLRNKGGWKIYDIEVSQLSLVTNYRSSFAIEIDKNGIDGLISLLKSRNGGSG